MRAGLLLRIAIYAIGLYSIQGAVSSGSYYLQLAGSSSEFSQGFSPLIVAGLFGHLVFPLLFALGCFGFAGALERTLLGPAAGERIELSDASVTTTLRTGLKLIGVYLGALYLAPLIATIYEGVALKTGSKSFDGDKIASDLIANGLGVALAAACCFRTDLLLRALHAREQSA